MTRKGKSRKRIAVLSILILLTVGIAGGIRWYFHWNLTVETVDFQESVRQLHNPDRGFYYIYGFRIKDEPVDWSAEVNERLKEDTETSLSLIEINLQEYRTGAISEAGMNNMQALFAALAAQERHYIVRFLYDWDGANEQMEPQSIEIILGHMKQVGPIIQKYADRIFTLQGLFVGNWGEMNGTRYTDEDSLQRLASMLASVSDPGTYLAVRTPVQWRKVTQISDLEELRTGRSPYANRLGLFNDGMLGNEGDYGTYGTKSKAEVGSYKEWTRDEELEFQDVLCRTVPIGGEVINDNEYNDLNHAIDDFCRMHVTYLNEDYDRAVLRKWSQSVVHTEDCFNGMDGLSYMTARMGYRFVLRECRMQQDFWQDTLQVELDVQNVGFAPIYRACEARLVFVPKAGGQEYSVTLEQDLAKLKGGNETDETATLRTIIPLHSLAKESYDVYFLLRDAAGGETIYFGNEQDCGRNGYQIGQILQ